MKKYTCLQNLFASMQAFSQRIRGITCKPAAMHVMPIYKNKHNDKYLVFNARLLFGFLFQQVGQMHFHGTLLQCQRVYILPAPCTNSCSPCCNKLCWYDCHASSTCRLYSIQNSLVAARMSNVYNAC